MNKFKARGKLWIECEANWSEVKERKVFEDYFVFALGNNKN